MFSTSYYLEEGNRNKKQIATIKQLLEDKYPSKYVSNQACADIIMSDVAVLASKIYRTTHGTERLDLNKEYHRKIKEATPL